MEYEIEDLLPIVAELAQEYAGYDSTSVTYEKAQMLMAGVIYCLNESRQQAENYPADKRMSVREQYLIGYKRVLEKAEEARKIYNALSVYFDSYNVECLGDTVIKGIPAFMKWYDAKYCPHDTILTLDYPLLCDIRALSGIDAIYAYLRAIETEQIFLQKFDRNYVLSVLRRANPGYEQMLENICDIMLLNTVGHAALGKPLSDRGFKESEYEKLQALFTSDCIDDTADHIRSIIREMTSRLYEDGRGTFEYFCNDVNNMAVRIDTAVRTSHPDKIFLL